MPYCQRCGTETAAAASFCSSCGARLERPPGAVTTGDVAGTGIAIGHGASASVTQGVSGEQLVRLFDGVRAAIAARESDPAVEEELQDAVDAIEEEAARGEQADVSRVRRWLNRLGELAPDVLAVAATALLDPVAGVAEGVRQLAAAVRDDPEDQGAAT